MSSYYKSAYTGEEIDNILDDVSPLKETIKTVEDSIELLEQNLGDGSNFVKKQDVNQPLGVAGLDGQGELNIEQIPSSLRGNVIDTREMAEETSSKFAVSDAGLRYYGDINAIPSPLEWFLYTTDENYNVHINGLSNKYLAVVADTDFDGIVVIPYEIDGKKVVSVGDLNYSSLVNVVIPNTVTSLDNMAFSGSGLVRISIPDSVKHITDRLVSSCLNLEEVILPDGIIDIAEGAFMGCAELKTIDIPKSVNSIGAYAFEGCGNLKNIVIPNGVNKIYSMTFDGCPLDTITIPESVKEIECTFNKDVIIICVKGSYAETYAKENGYNYVYDMLSPSEYVGDISVAENILKVTKGDGSIKDLTLPTGESSSSTITVDDELSDTSENPVQNKAIKAELDKKLDIEVAKINDFETSATDWWNINVFGVAQIANQATEAINDSYGNKITETYLISVVPFEETDKSIRLSLVNYECDSVYKDDLYKYKIATTDYVDNVVGDAKVYVVEVTLNEDGSVTSETTFEMVNDTYNQGKNIILKCVDATTGIVVIGLLTSKNDVYFAWSVFIGNSSYEVSLGDEEGWNYSERTFAEEWYVEEQIGEIETALDNIIAIQNTLIGGDSV